MMRRYAPLFALVLALAVLLQPAQAQTAPFTLNTATGVVYVRPSAGSSGIQNITVRADLLQNGTVVATGRRSAATSFGFTTLTMSISPSTPVTFNSGDVLTLNLYVYLTCGSYTSLSGVDLYDGYAPPGTPDTYVNLNTDLGPLRYYTQSDGSLQPTQDPVTHFVPTDKLNYCAATPFPQASWETTIS